MAKAPTDIRSLARSHTRMCIRTLAAIARTVDAPPAARIAAADILLDRGWGRAVQHVEQSGEVRQLVEVKLSVVSSRSLPGDDASLIEHNDIKELEQQTPSLNNSGDGGEPK